MESKQLLADAEKLAPALCALRRRFHQIPEPARAEVKTAALATETLCALPGVNVRGNVFATGILADIRGVLPGPVIALRADMDALSITEETGLPFASGTPGMMHACGHDFHITSLLGAAMLLSTRRENLRGTVRLILQPSEEFSPEGGSRGMIAAGALEGVSAVYGMHVWPDLPFGTVGVKAGPLMACSDHFYVYFHGRSAHAARPDQGADALQAGCRFAADAQTIVSRSISPMDSAVVSIGKIAAGERYNILPQECVLEGTARTLVPAVRDAVEAGLSRIAAGCAAAMGCTAEVEYQRGYCPTVNASANANHVASVQAALFGENAVLRLSQPTMIAEDFGFYLEKTPGCFFWLGTQKPDEPHWPLHSCHFAPDEGLLWRGAALMAGLALLGTAPHEAEHE